MEGLVSMLSGGRGGRDNPVQDGRHKNEGIQLRINDNEDVAVSCVRIHE